MRVIYKQKIFYRIVDAKREAERNHRIIQEIRLTVAEMDELEKMWLFRSDVVGFNNQGDPPRLYQVLGIPVYLE